MAPVVLALDQRGYAVDVILTGQQAIDRTEVGLGYLMLAQLDVGARANPHHHARAVARALRPYMPGSTALIVHGDTSSALGGAWAASSVSVPVIHVEAGLRTYDPRQPWPEERYRRAIDARSAVLLAPTPSAADNLRNERMPGHIFVTGNSGIDALLSVEASLPPARLHESGRCRILVTCHRRENWGTPMRAIAVALRKLALEEPVEITCVLHPNPKASAELRTILSPLSAVQLRPPSSHRDLVDEMRTSDLILSDSGGIQEEAPALGVPLLVLRDKTERPEAIATGNARLVGTNEATIVTEVRRLLHDPLARAAMSRRAFPFGDGRSAVRIADAIDAWLAGKGEREARVRRA